MIYLFPVLLLLIGVVYRALRSSGRGRSGRGVDLGDAFLFVLLMYGFVPGIGFLLASLGVGQIVDQRMADGFVTADVEYVQLMHLALISGFAAAYIAARRPNPNRQDQALRLEAGSLMLPLVIFALMISLGVPLAMRVWGANVGDDYMSSYTALRDAPMLIQQLFGVATQLQFAAVVAAVVVVVAAKPHRHHWVAVALGVNVLFAALSGGSRSVAFLSFFAYIVARSIFVPGFTLRSQFILVVPAIALFMVAGMLRDKNPDASFLDLFQTGEFTVLFVNAVDLKDRFANGLADEVRFAFYLVDVIRLIPGQLLGGVKLDPAQWYAETFYPEYFDAGGGFAFGILAECVAGGGVLEAALRGVLLGLLFAFSANRLIGTRLSMRRAFVYVWMVALCYQSYRDTTFSLLVRGLYQLVPMLLLMSMFRRSAKLHLQVQAVST